MTTETDDDLLENLKVTFEEGEWRKQALCKDMPVDLFFPERAQMVSKEAKEACAACPVQTECLDYAIRMPIVIGFWGGKNVRQRRDLRREWLKANNIKVNTFASNKKEENNNADHAD